MEEERGGGGGMDVTEEQNMEARADREMKRCERQDRMRGQRERVREDTLDLDYCHI